MPNQAISWPQTYPIFFSRTGSRHGSLFAVRLHCSWRRNSAGIAEYPQCHSRGCSKQDFAQKLHDTWYPLGQEGQTAGRDPTSPCPRLRVDAQRAFLMFSWVHSLSILLYMATQWQLLTVRPRADIQAETRFHISPGDLHFKTDSSAQINVYQLCGYLDKQCLVIYNSRDDDSPCPKVKGFHYMVRLQSKVSCGSCP